MSNIDDLLNEVNDIIEERKIMPPNKQDKFEQDYDYDDYENKKKNQNQKETKISDNIDDLLQDLDYDEPINQNQYQQSKPKQLQKQETQSDPTLPKIKCSPILVSNQSGISNDQNYLNKKICDKLRCTNCDLKVSIFNNFKWMEDCNYLFFRNYYSQKQELQSKLVKDYSCSAYSCQCSWESVKKTQEVQSLGSKKWVCSGHQNQ